MGNRGAGDAGVRERGEGRARGDVADVGRGGGVASVGKRMRRGWRVARRSDARGWWSEEERRERDADADDGEFVRGTVYHRDVGGGGGFG